MAVDFGSYRDDVVNKFLRLAIHGFDLYFLYHGTDGRSHELVYSILYDYWRSVERAARRPPSCSRPTPTRAPPP